MLSPLLTVVALACSSSPKSAALATSPAPTASPTTTETATATPPPSTATAAPSVTPPAPQNKGPNTNVSTKLEVPKLVQIGSKVVLRLRNTDSQDYRYLHPGGTSGCAAFRWNLRLTDASGTMWAQEIPFDAPRACTTVMVPPSWIVIPAGEAMHIRLNTGRVFYDVSGGPPWAMKKRWEGKALEPGLYKVTVNGPGIRHDEQIELR